MIKIAEITAKETYTVRHPVLRPGKPLESCHFDGDSLETTKHFGLFIDSFLVGIISLFETANPSFTQKKQFQIRGMAILDDHQRMGFGEKLIKHVESYSAQHSFEVLWFNARETAVGFYIRMGYSIVGDAFLIPDVGVHYVMFKSL